jgi:hypothetical protein
MMDEKFLQNRIAAAFDENELEPHVVADIAFHMTDWKEDLDQLVSLYNRMDTADAEEIRTVVIRFLCHAPNHLAAAKKLIGLGPMEDIFEVGILRDDDEPGGVIFSFTP